jgi:N-acetylmuramoyl-L-alanine amidase
MMLWTMLIAASLQIGEPANEKNTSAVAPRARSSASVKRASRAPAAARVIIDAGHGGRDPGAPVRNTSLREKDIALQMALKVGDALRAKGVEVYYTRVKDTLIALHDRGRMANQAKGDLFISIHVNAANPGWRNPDAARGFETYFLAEARTEDARRVEEMENESIRFESDAQVKQNDPLSFILSDMMQNEHLRESSDLAEIVQKHMIGSHPGPNRGVKQAGFRVLVSAFMPAILVELGFGTNADDAAYMANPSKQRLMARAIADATLEYLERHQRRVGGGAAGAANDHD